MNKGLRSASITLIIGFCAAAYGETNNADVRRVNVQGYGIADEVYAALYNGGGIYLCQLLDREQVRQDGVLESGLAKLNVVSTIRGTMLEKLSLPYSFPPSGFVKGLYCPIWPNLDKVRKDQFLLCVVIPEGYDPCCSVSNAQGAASIVEVVDRKDSPAVKEMAFICSLHRIQDTNHLASALAKAMADSRPRVSRYALHAAAHKLAVMDPQLAVEVIGGALQKQELGYSEALDAVDALADIAAFGKRVTPGRMLTKEKVDAASEIAASGLKGPVESATRVLVQLITGSDKGLRNRAILRLATLVANGKFKLKTLSKSINFSAMNKALNGLDESDSNQVRESATIILKSLGSD